MSEQQGRRRRRRRPGKLLPIYLILQLLAIYCLSLKPEEVASSCFSSFDRRGRWRPQQHYHQVGLLKGDFCSQGLSASSSRRRNTRRKGSVGRCRHRRQLALNAQSKDTKDPFDLLAIEKEVYASAQEVLDRKRVLEALMKEDSNKNSQLQSLSSEQDDIVTAPAPAPQWKIALAAAVFSSALSYVVAKNLVIAAVILLAVFFAANADPLDEDEENAPYGALARLLGRATLKSVEASQPKMKALARAVLTGEEEILELKANIRQLETENAELRLWKQRRTQVDDHLSQFTLDELKDYARKNKLPVGGTKSQLLMRLLEAEVLYLLDLS